MEVGNRTQASPLLWDRVHTSLVLGLHAKSLQLCTSLCDPLDHNLPGFSVHGILQAKILAWVAMPSSKGSSQPRDRTHVSFVSSTSRWVLYHWFHLGSPTGATFVPKPSVMECVPSSTHTPRRQGRIPIGVSCFWTRG